MQVIEFLLAMTLIFCVILSSVEHVLGLPVSDSTVNTDFEGRSLVTMGAAMNSPLLRLLGRTFEKLEHDVTRVINNKTELVLAEIKKDNNSLEQRLVSERKELINIICQIHVCTEWTAWSDCTARFNGTYGAQSRSRTCRINNVNLCPNGGQGKEEGDSRVCEGQKLCPMMYSSTKNGFCLRLHTEKRLKWTYAQDVCKQAGGFLANIDSDLIAVDVNNTLQKLKPLTDPFWIDGTRTLPSGTWRNEYGPRDQAYTNWASSEPDSTDDCKAYDLSGSWYWWGRPCTSTYYFICEVIANIGF